MLGMTADFVVVAAVVVLYDIFVVVVVGFIVVAVAAAAVVDAVVAGIFAAVLFTEFCRKSRQSVNTPPPRCVFPCCCFGDRWAAVVLRAVLVLLWCC